MNDDLNMKLSELAYECERFLNRLNRYRAAMHENPPAPRESGALRRSSLDLTRALADFRRPS